MSEERKRLRTPSPSMLQAAAELHRVSGRAGAPGWVDEARAVIRRAMTAVESELGEMNPAGGAGARMAGHEPRLIPAMEQIEAGLAEMLLLLWNATAHRPGADVAEADLSDLATQFQQLADRTFDVFQESLVSTGGGD